MRRFLWQIAVILFWLLIWHLTAVAIDSQILLVTPMRVLTRLGSLVGTAAFRTAVRNSLGRILQGFTMAVFCGIFLAGLSQKRFVYMLLDPVISLMKATPVASITILILFWVPGPRLAVIISFMMVLPIIFYNVYEGMRSIDRKVMEMAEIFNVTLWKKHRFIIFPSLLPYLVSACSIGFGQAWKSGIAAEVIALPRDSIGINLYNAKVYLENAELLAWTVVIVLLSFAMEKAFILILNRLGFSERKKEGIG